MRPIVDPTLRRVGLRLLARPRPFRLSGCIVSRVPGLRRSEARRFVSRERIIYVTNVREG